MLGHCRLFAGYRRMMVGNPSSLENEKPDPFDGDAASERRMIKGKMASAIRA